ncbi:prevent-host-death family protein [Cryobacterium sp. MP_M5]|uniref:type II toxin-antitoxin system Phd/YefM family antitoxin n=1 Tax=unclassified Cryobacterium TaxID=2649013 RepID=UPI0018CA4C7F|nr:MULTISPECIES: type II toxin-antitoxin system prevent-host-death family antitoxin [unclassified Cryobacterium]MBG6057946.1 prevent-host-death family protein [Cryobacterium sp. MP_M3]MEC5176145.1 prevent-host-death family protein [Cryobacterium sp. MP_M5]
MFYPDDLDQLPELPDPGPRDGRHGVDRDPDYDPYPLLHSGTGRLLPLTVSVPDARWHLGVLLDRVEAGEEILLTRRGRPVARIVPFGPPVRAAVTRAGRRPPRDPS